ncbi:hypothetical protein EVAR_60855_1 [Eumeta japonica]|uniref:Uncharacterized protein n=1 Tax=Eumeta variegata TaxID=151549 RepID=A0A4C1Y9K0_EUMVA|nr:hypothetical protein EVAR_60855_1 [Eumeta japonica]
MAFLVFHDKWLHDNHIEAGCTLGGALARGPGTCSRRPTLAARCVNYTRTDRRPPTTKYLAPSECELQAMSCVGLRVDAAVAAHNGGAAQSPRVAAGTGPTRGGSTRASSSLAVSDASS